MAATYWQGQNYYWAKLGDCLGPPQHLPLLFDSVTKTQITKMEQDYCMVFLSPHPSAAMGYSVNSRI